MAPNPGRSSKAGGDDTDDDDEGRKVAVRQRQPSSKGRSRRPSVDDFAVEYHGKKEERDRHRRGTSSDVPRDRKKSRDDADLERERRKRREKRDRRDERREREKKREKKDEVTRTSSRKDAKRKKKKGDEYVDDGDDEGARERRESRRTAEEAKKSSSKLSRRLSEDDMAQSELEREKRRRREERRRSLSVAPARGGEEGRTSFPRRISASAAIPSGTTPSNLKGHDEHFMLKRRNKSTARNSDSDSKPFLNSRRMSGSHDRGSNHSESYRGSGRGSPPTPIGNKSLSEDDFDARTKRLSQDSNSSMFNRESVKSEGEGDLDVRKTRLSQGSLSSSFNRFKPASIINESDDALDARKKRLSQDSPNNGASRSKTTSSSGKVMKEASRGLRNETSKPVEKSIGSKDHSNGLEKDDDNASDLDGDDRRRIGDRRDRSSKEGAKERVTRAASSGIKPVRRSSISDGEEKKMKKKRRSHDDQRPRQKKEHPIRRHSLDDMVNYRGMVKNEMKKRGLYPSKSTREERGAHTGSYLPSEDLLSGGRQLRRKSQSSSSSEPMKVHHEDSLLGERRRRRKTQASSSTEPKSLVTAVTLGRTTPPGQPTSEIAQNGGQRLKVSACSRRYCLCCMTIIILLLVAAIAAFVIFIILQYFGKAPNMPSFPNTAQAATESPAASYLLATNMPSVAPSIVPTEQQMLNTATEQHLNSTAPTQSQLTTNDVTIAVIVQLDGKPEDIGFLLISADNSTTYISRPVGSLSNMHSEVVMEVVTIPKKIELMFTLEDASGDGLCCTHGDGYYRVFAGTGDKKTTIVSGEQAGKYIFTVGVQQAALQIDGVDPNENCKPCPTGKDCGRCAWCDAKKGFMSDTMYSYQCHSSATPIPRKCWTGDKRFQLHNQYVVAMAGCAEGLEPWPQVQTSNGTTLCVEETKCIKSYPFVKPDCNHEFPGSILVEESCQDKIGGIPFGYSWSLNAPRENECASSGSFITSLASRCCVDGVAFCSVIDVENMDAGREQEKKTPTPTPIKFTSLSPTSSYAPTWDGHPLIILIQLDDFPQETGISIMSNVNGKNVTFLQRQEGYYKQSQQLVVENVQIPEGITAVLTLTDKEGDGFCCASGNGYIQVYSSVGSVILDSEGVFETSMSKSFLVGEPQSFPPTVSASPSASFAPIFDLFPITIAMQLDQWSSETGLTLQSDVGETLFDWPANNFSEIPSSLFIETVFLPYYSEVTVQVTDTGGDGFCCLYGDGYIKIFAGDNAEDESALLAFESAEFESELQIIFLVGPAPTVSPATTSTPSVIANKTASIGPTSSSPQSIDAFLVTVVLQLDEYSAETSWSIDSSDGMTNFVSRPFGYYEEMKSQKVIETVRLPEGLEYQFKIVDFMGDGTCCWAGHGWYDLYEGEDIEDEDFLIFHGNGDFGQHQVHTFTAGEPKTPAPDGLGASSKPIASTAQSYVPISISSGEPETPPINSKAPSKTPTSASYNKTTSIGLPILNNSFQTSNEATPMLRGSVPYDLERQRKHVHQYP